MNTMSHKTDNLKISDKRIYHLMKWLLPLLLGILITLSSFTAISSNRWARDEIINKQLRIAQITKENLDYRFSLQQTATSSLMTSVYSYLVSNESDSSSYEEYNSMNRLLRAYDASDYMIRLYVPDEKNYSSQKDLFFPLSSIDLNPNLKPYARQIGVNWIPSHDVISGIKTYKDMIGCMFTMARSDNYNAIAGSLILYMPAERLNQSFISNTTESEEIFLVDASGAVIAHPDPTRIGKSALNPEELGFLSSANSKSKLVHGELMAFSKLECVDWYLVVRSRSKAFVFGTPTASTRILLWLLSFLAIVVGVMLVMENFLLDKVFSSIRDTIGKLSEQSYKKNVATNDISQKKGKTIQYLLSNRMQDNVTNIVSEVSRSVEARYQEKMELIEYQMQSLQSQIKPHFLYNTLDIIKWMIVSGNYNESVDTINSLSRYLRMSISKKTNIVTLNDELILGKTYVDIIKQRFKEKFEFVVEVDEDTKNCLLPKFILQPLIENSLVHGLLYCNKSDLKLTVRAWLEDTSLCMEIEDNGSGIASEKLLLLKNDAIEAKEGYGLKNTRTRLILFNGEDTTFDISSFENVGTCITIKIKAKVAE